MFMPIRIMRDCETYPVVEASVLPVYPEKRGFFGPRDGDVTAEMMEGEWIFRVVCPEAFREKALRRGYAACVREAKGKGVRHLLIRLLQPKTGDSRAALNLALDALYALPELGEMDVYLRIPEELGTSPAWRQPLEDYLNRNTPRERVSESIFFGAAPQMPCPMPPAPMAMPRKMEIPMETDAGFSETLLSLIDKRGKKDSEIYNRANVSRQHFSKIRNNPDYKPTKATAIAFAIALELDMEETRDLIGRAGYALTRSSKFDLIIMYFIQQKNYNLFDINEALYEYDQSLLGA